uniref:175 kDa protein n=1 Tax=Suizhou Fusar tick virus 1 TaxID=2972103 RepID=A0A9E7V1T5_9VIRU|nr:MAG: 175 kDa protein [Suizhou Fusar tick virus 1]
MASWNVDMRLEASGKLENIPFLSKYGRRPTPADREEFMRAQMPVPEWVVYHDKSRLVGKLTARTLTNDPRYAVKRMISYLDLCAHHPDVYMAISQAIDQTIKDSSRSFLDKKPVVPSYRKILYQWYNREGRMPPGPDFDEANEGDIESKLVIYGEVTLLDQFVNILASTPDVLNPVVTSIGYPAFLQEKFKYMLSWPIELLARQNSLLTEAQISQVVPRTLYGFLSVRFGAPVATTKMSSLLVRHWILFCLRAKTQYFGVPNFILSLSKKFGDIQFIMNAQVQYQIFNLDFQPYNLFLVGILSLIDVPFEASWLSRLRLPNPSLLWDGLVNFLYVNFWYYVPPNYKDILHFMDTLVPGKPTLITAPTGTGKSTTMVSFINRVSKTRFPKLILIEPRSILVKTLVPFLTKSIGINASGLTSGLVLDRTADVYVMTPQEFLLHKDFWTTDYLIMLDEAHVIEPAYEALKIVCRQFSLYHLFVTATPTETLNVASNIRYDLRMASFFSVDVQDVAFPASTTFGRLANDYWDIIKSLIRTDTPQTVYLIFVPDVKMGLDYVNRAPFKATLISSGKTDIPKGCKFIFTTSVADAGLTIPSVDVVISMDFDRRVGVLPDEHEVTPFMVKLDNQILRQRQGRTGRTNNGVFYKVVSNAAMKSGIKEDYKPSIATMISDLLATGLSGKDIVTIYPDLVVDFLEIEKGPGDYGTIHDRKVMDPVLDTFGRQVDNFIGNNAASLYYKQYQSGLSTNDGSERLMVERARAGILWKSPKPVSEVFSDMIEGAAKSVNFFFPDIAKFSDPNDIREKLWDYVNTFKPYTHYFPSENDFQIQNKTYPDFGARRKDYESKWTEISDVWKEE